MIWLWKPSRFASPQDPKGYRNLTNGLLSATCNFNHPENIGEACMTQSFEVLKNRNWDSILYEQDSSRYVFLKKILGDSDIKFSWKFAKSCKNAKPSHKYGCPDPDQVRTRSEILLLRGKNMCKLCIPQSLKFLL